MDIVRLEGPLGLWRGNLAVVLQAGMSASHKCQPKANHKTLIVQKPEQLSELLTAPEFYIYIYM